LPRCSPNKSGLVNSIWTPKIIGYAPIDVDAENFFSILDDGHCLDLGRVNASADSRPFQFPRKVLIREDQKALFGTPIFSNNIAPSLLNILQAWHGWGGNISLGLYLNAERWTFAYVLNKKSEWNSTKRSQIEIAPNLISDLNPWSLFVLHFGELIYQRPSLHGKDSGSYYADNDEPSSPLTDDSRPSGDLITGVICIGIGLFIAWYAGGHEGGDEHKKRQYVIETVFCFGAAIIAVFLVTQGAILIIFGSWIL
jgi:hypothetical protein